MIKINSEEILKQVTQKCIRCGFCVYSCPSWSVHGMNEYYSPRGRVTLIKAMVNDPNFKIEEAVDSIYTCNTCRRCYIECPTGVDVAELSIYARDYIAKKLNAVK
jgi:glycolate oxidase iron-sulfur subunit